LGQKLAQCCAEFGTVFAISGERTRLACWR
jgi:hypothetical protein